MLDNLESDFASMKIDMRIKYLRLGHQNVNYFSNVELNADNAQNIRDLTHGFIIWETYENCVMINWLYTNKQYEHNGYGTYLVNHVIRLAQNNPQISRLELDDMSDNAWKLDKNIYVKCGFKYKHSYPCPEMELILDKT